MKNILFVAASLFILTSCIAQTHEAEIVTNYGKITVMLYDGTPLHRDNFIKLVNNKTYDSLLFHRVIWGFMIQAGDPMSKYASDTAMLGDGDLGYTVPAEIMPDKYYHKRGALAAARDENPTKASSACQFYIVQGKIANDSTFIKSKIRTDGYETPEAHKQVYRTEGGVPHLDSRYTVFGEVVKGMNVVDKIAAVDTDKNDRPKKNVRIKTVKMTK
jgi:peptidyl-prolyl cis-trans isomerase B (cyclophilin B)